MPKLMEVRRAAVEEPMLVCSGCPRPVPSRHGGCAWCGGQIDLLLPERLHWSVILRNFSGLYDAADGYADGYADSHAAGCTNGPAVDRRPPPRRTALPPAVEGPTVPPAPCGRCAAFTDLQLGTLAEPYELGSYQISTRGAILQYGLAATPVPVPGLALAPQEQRVLGRLARARGEPVPRPELVAALWGTPAGDIGHALNQVVMRLNRKLRDWTTLEVRMMGRGRHLTIKLPGKPPGGAAP